MSKVMNRCQKCKNELVAEARFCNICGAPQNPENAQSAPPIPPEKSPDPARTMQPSSKHTYSPQVSGGNPNQPAKTAHPPILPKRPNAGRVIAPVALPQRDTPQVASSLQPATAHNSSDLAIPPENPQPETRAPVDVSTSPGKANTEKTSDSSDQSQDKPVETIPPVPPLAEPPAPTRTPGIIRSIESSIPTRPAASRPPTTVRQTPATPPTHLPPSPPASTQSPQRPGPAHAPADAQTQNKRPLSDLPTQHIKSDSKQGRQQTPVVRSSTPPSRQTPPAHDLDKLPTGHLPSTNGQNGLGNEQTMPLLSPESFIATSKAAEHWRNSWRDRQYAEAGPAEDVSRGHAAVPMPLMAMQRSFARMRAIARTKNDGRSTNFRFWITLFLLICIIAGLGAYVVSTYLPNSPVGAAQVVPPANTAQPSLTLQRNPSGTFAIGQVIHLHGDHFGSTNPITFLLDTTSPITGAGGKQISTHPDSQGAFDVALTIGSDWTTGTHTIEAVDSSGNQDAYLTIQVVPAGTPVTTSPDLSVTTDGKPVQVLTFKAVAGQPNPAPQPITITNTSGMQLKWSATTSANNNLSWLNINDHNTFGLLNISEPDTLLISVNSVGLTSNLPKKPYYTGQIVFTINDKEQLTLPVQLQITDATPEMVFSPSPLIAHGTACSSGVPGVPVTLTLINLGSAYINWSVTPDLKNNISFVDPVHFKREESGQLAPSGQPGDTQILVLQCSAIQTVRPYTVSVYANGMSWSELVIIQP